MTSPHELLSNNQRWATRVSIQQPGFFERLAEQQQPTCLWIGCADSRVPASCVVDAKPGELFVHRNIANVVGHTDLGVLSSIQFAVEVLKVSHILVVGHYGCGGVGAALKQSRLGLIDNWLCPIGEIARKHQCKLDPSLEFDTHHARLCELNALEQAVNVCRSSVVQAAWDRGQELGVRAWIYALKDGHIHDLGLDIRSTRQLPTAYENVLKRLDRQWQGPAEPMPV